MDGITASAAAGHGEASGQARRTDIGADRLAAPHAPHGIALGAGYSSRDPVGIVRLLARLAGHPVLEVVRSLDEDLRPRVPRLVMLPAGS